MKNFIDVEKEREHDKPCLEFRLEPHVEHSPNFEACSLLAKLCARWYFEMMCLVFFEMANQGTCFLMRSVAA